MAANGAFSIESRYFVKACPFKCGYLGEALMDDNPLEHIKSCRVCQIGWAIVATAVALIVWSAWLSLS